MSTEHRPPGDVITTPEALESCPSRWQRIEERLFCLGMAYLTGMVAYSVFTVWENPWLGVFVAVSAVGWLLQPYNHGGSR